MKKCISLFVVLIMLLNSCVFNRVSFENLYNNYCHNQPWAKLAEDDSYLLIDTTWRGNENYKSNSDELVASVFLNKYGIEELYYIDAYDAIENINKEIGFPEILNEKIIRTKSGEDIKNGVKIAWKSKSTLSIEVWYSHE